jgi:hypothetical protein
LKGCARSLAGCEIFPHSPRIQTIRKENESPAGQFNQYPAKPAVLKTKLDGGIVKVSIHGAFRPCAFPPVQKSRPGLPRTAQANENRTQTLIRS